MKIKIDDTEYELNKELALLHGALTVIHKKIISINPGDLFIHPKARVSSMVVAKVSYANDLFVLLGVGNMAFKAYNTEVISEPRPAADIIRWLNKYEMVFKKDMSDVLPHTL